MAITAVMVKELRTRTGAGMMDCKRALTEVQGDMDAAVELLRKKGAAKADKKAGRIAAEGVVAARVSEDRSVGVVVEVNCETDFVAKDDSFLTFAQAVAEAVLVQRPANLEALNALTLAGASIEETRQVLVAKIGENIAIRRYDILNAQSDATVSAYVHGTRIAVLVSASSGKEELGRDIAMHVAASRPLCVSNDDVPETTLAKEREIFTAQAESSGKPVDIVEKIVQGQLQKFVKEITLLGQTFVKNSDISVDKLLKLADAEVFDFIRYEVGEGLERRADDFVAEVMAQAKGA